MTNIKFLETRRVLARGTRNSILFLVRIVNYKFPTALVRGTRNSFFKPNNTKKLVALIRGAENNFFILYKIVNFNVQIHRKSYFEIDKTYFFTATIHQWLPLMSCKENKELIINYLKELSDRDLIKVYAFVIMPNHVHFIWQQLQKNGKESPQGSFLKYTAHEFLKTVKQNGTSKLYEVNAANKKHEIWQRDSLSIEIRSRKFAKQKLHYIHFNPVRGKWNLVKDHLDYFYSSARFYETGVDEFGFLNNLFHG